ncbi:MAG: hypothetical protein ACFFB3_13220 [Candidatus Hodarchaeota archaeon]
MQQRDTLENKWLNDWQYWLYEDEELEIIQEGADPVLFLLLIAAAMLSFVGGLIASLLILLDSKKPINESLFGELFLPAFITLLGALATGYSLFNILRMYSYPPKSRSLLISICTAEKLPDSTPMASLVLNSQKIVISLDSHSYMKDQEGKDLPADFKRQSPERIYYYMYSCLDKITLPLNRPISLTFRSKRINLILSNRDPKKKKVPQRPELIIFFVKVLTLFQT